jgi:zinc transport system permease protein
MPDFIWLALAGALLITLMSAPVGAFMLWRRMAFVGDALAHTTLLGLGIGLWLQIPIQLSLLLVSVIVAVSITRIHQRNNLSTDTFIAIAAHSSLALGMLVVTLLPEARIDLMGYLFGDLLNLTMQDIWGLLIASLLTLSILYRYWQGLILTCLNAELARLAGHDTQKLNLILALLIALIIALSTKLVGALLITALLITPAAIARRWSQTPIGMIQGAIVISWLAIAIGISLSWHFDLPVSPAIVAVLFAGFIASRALTNQNKL